MAILLKTPSPLPGLRKLTISRAIRLSRDWNVPNYSQQYCFQPISTQASYTLHFKINIFSPTILVPFRNSSGAWSWGTSHPPNSGGGTQCPPSGGRGSRSLDSFAAEIHIHSEIYCPVQYHWSRTKERTGQAYQRGGLRLPGCQARGWAQSANPGTVYIRSQTRGLAKERKVLTRSVWSHFWSKGNRIVTSHWTGLQGDILLCDSSPLLHLWVSRKYICLTEVGGEWKGDHGYEKPLWHRKYHTEWSTAIVKENQHPLLEPVLAPHWHGQSFSKRAFGTVNVHTVVYLSYRETLGRLSRDHGGWIKPWWSHILHDIIHTSTA